MDGVGRRVLEDDDAGRHLDVGLDQLEDPAASGDERVAVDRRALDVLVAAERVEVVRLVVVERRLLAEPAERRVRIGVDVDVVRVVVHVAPAGGGHAPLPGLRIRASTVTRIFGGTQGAASADETVLRIVRSPTARRAHRERRTGIVSATTSTTAEATPDRWYQLSPEEVAARLDVDPARGPVRRRGGAAAAGARLQRARRQGDGVGAAGVPPPVPGPDADHPGGRGDREPGGHRRVGHHDRPGRPDDLQRRARSAPGGQGGGEPGRPARRC